MTLVSSTQSSNSKKAIVLSGGSIRGAFQAGALNAIFQSGYRPDVIHGISAGALNAAWLANETGKIGENISWEDAGKGLSELWLNNIQSPRDVIRKRSIVGIGLNILFRNFKGLIDPAPLKALLKTHLNRDNIGNSPAQLLIGAVNLISGDIEHKYQTDRKIVDFVLASASMPIIFPPAFIRGMPYTDGGIRDIAPLKHVIAEGVDEIIIVVTQPDPIERLKLGRTFRPGRVTHLIDRVVDIFLNEILLNDLKELKKVNQDLIALQPCMPTSRANSLENKRLIKFKIIRPEGPYPATIMNFQQEDIKEMIEEGFAVGSNAMKQPFETGVSNIQKDGVV